MTNIERHKYLEEKQIPIMGEHIHGNCNLGNCSYLSIDLSTPVGRAVWNLSLIMHHDGFKRMDGETSTEFLKRTERKYGLPSL